MLSSHLSSYPRKIVCLTEEILETLFLLNEESRIVGRSQFAIRPAQALKIPIVTQFNRANIDKITELKPDLIIGYSDVQKDIARQLIEAGQNVFISNHRSIKEILDYILMIGSLVNKHQQAENIVNKIKALMEKVSQLSHQYFGNNKPKVYFEEWDEPLITSSLWIHEIIEICGGINIFPQKSSEFLAKNRIVSHQEVCQQNPDIIFLCWCGKKANIEQVKNRPDYQNIKAIKNNHLYEVIPEIFLQPGPAALFDGIPLMFEYLQKIKKI
jgi:iron complex transport system substrate-binding protein